MGTTMFVAPDGKLRIGNYLKPHWQCLKPIGGFMGEEEFNKQVEMMIKVVREIEKVVINQIIQEHTGRPVTCDDLLMIEKDWLDDQSAKAYVLRYGKTILGTVELIYDTPNTLKVNHEPENIKIKFYPLKPNK